GPGTAMEEHDRDSLRVSRLLVVHAVRPVELEQAARERLDGRKQRQQLAVRGMLFLGHGGNLSDVHCVKDSREINSVHYAASQHGKGRDLSGGNALPALRLAALRTRTLAVARP